MRMLLGSNRDRVKIPRDGHPISGLCLDLWAKSRQSKKGITVSTCNPFEFTGGSDGT